jgi:hypothetical protein
MILIPVADQNDSLTEIELDGEVYYLHLAWNSEAEFWTLGLESVDHSTVVEGIFVVPDTPLLSRYRVLGMPPGEIMAIAPDRGNLIARSDLPSGRVSLIYATLDDVLAAV